MIKQIGWEGLLANAKREAPQLAKMLPQWPRLLTRALEHAAHGADEQAAMRVLVEAVERQGRRVRALTLIVLFLAATLFVGAVWHFRN